MALDTAEKRMAVSGIQSTLVPGVTPRASKDIEWRQESGWGYPGIVPTGGVAASGGGGMSMRYFFLSGGQT